jgi:hypothetical protein
MLHKPDERRGPYWSLLALALQGLEGLPKSLFTHVAQVRWMKKVVTKSGEYDGTVVYLYDGWKIVETRDGSSNVVQQFIHGTQ